ncbi:MAG: SpoIIE family protein phosphatase, partial [Spirochaetes bacterium]|nr:SpoIIE family protein phosphatase [Spirochaetota bacterium]
PSSTPTPSPSPTPTPSGCSCPGRSPPPAEVVRRDRAAGAPYLVTRLRPPGGREELVYNFSIPIQAGERVLGSVRLGIAKNSLESAKEESRSRWQTRILVVSLFLVVVLFLLYMGNAFVSPIKNFAEAISQIGTLDYSMEKLKNIRVAEFEAIEQALSKMTGRLKDAEVQLTDQTRIKREMQLAKDIQNTILPRVIPTTKGFELDGRYRSALEMGGDYYDFFEVGENLMGIVVGDVSGKGIGAAFIMAIARMAMRSESREIRRASDVLTKVDNLIRKDIKKGMYITVFYAVLDSEKRTISYSSAGHNPMILYRGSEKAVYFLNPKGIAIGLSVEDGFFKKMITSETITIQSDDLIFMYTDGITEAMNPQRKEYGEARLVEFIKRNHERSTTEFCNLLDKDIEDFTAGYPQSDDITYIVVKAKPTEEEIRYGNIVRLYDLLKAGTARAEALAACGIEAADFDEINRAVKAEGLEALKPEAVGGLSHASIEQSQKIVTIIRTHPDFGPARILKELNTAAYGFEILSENVLGKELKKLKLVTAAQRQRYAERRIASTSIHVGVTATLATPEASNRAAKARAEHAPPAVEAPPETAVPAASPTEDQIEPAEAAAAPVAPEKEEAASEPPRPMEAQRVVPAASVAKKKSPSEERPPLLEVEAGEPPDFESAGAAEEIEGLSDGDDSEPVAAGPETPAETVEDWGTAEDTQGLAQDTESAAVDGDGQTYAAEPSASQDEAAWEDSAAVEAAPLDADFAQAESPVENTAQDAGEAWAVAEANFAETGTLAEEGGPAEGEWAPIGGAEAVEGELQPEEAPIPGEAAFEGTAASWEQDPALEAQPAWDQDPAAEGVAWEEGPAEALAEEAGFEGGYIQEEPQPVEGAALAWDEAEEQAPLAENVEPAQDPAG